MKTICIKNESEDLLVEFDGQEWRIYSDEENFESIYHDIVETSPFFLHYEIKNRGWNADAILKELSGRSADLSVLFDQYFAERKRLESRTILLDKYGSGMIDTFSDLLMISGDEELGLTIETSIDGDPYDFETNALGEICVERIEGVRSAEQLYDAVLSATSDCYCRWEDIDWTWAEIISRLKPAFPALAVDLAQVVKNKAEAPA